MSSTKSTNPTGTQFTYTVRAVYLPDIGSNPDNRSGRLDVDVTWGGGTRKGAGRLQVQLCRLVNENSRY